jgi:hypothetical protein
MAQDIFERKPEHADYSDISIYAFVEQLRKHPAIDNILKPVVMPEDFESAFKYVPEKTAWSFSGRGVHHYKACTEEYDDGLSDIKVELRAEMMMVPLDAGLCPERWKQAVYFMLEKYLGSQDPKSYGSYSS